MIPFKKITRRPRSNAHSSAEVRELPMLPNPATLPRIMGPVEAAMMMEQIAAYVGALAVHPEYREITGPVRSKLVLVEDTLNRHAKVWQDDIGYRRHHYREAGVIWAMDEATVQQFQRYMWQGFFFCGEQMRGLRLPVLVRASALVDLCMDAAAEYAGNNAQVLDGLFRMDAQGADAA